MTAAVADVEAGHMTPQEVADALNVKLVTLTGWRIRGEGPEWVRLGRRLVRYPRAAFDAWYAEQQRSTAAEREDRR